MNSEPWDAIVIGGGASGLSAALTLGRASRRVLVIDAGEPRNRFAEHIHGMLGSEGVDPADYLARARREVERYGVVLRRDEVAMVTDEGGHLFVDTAAGERLTARRVIAASGAWDGLPSITGLPELWGRSVLHCPYCHGWEVRGRRLGLLATSSVSLHQVQLVRQWSEDLTFFSAEAGEIPVDVDSRLAARSVAIEPRPVEQLVRDGRDLVGVRVEGGDIIPVDAVFVSPILAANDRFLADLGLEREESIAGGFVKIDSSGRTSNPRVWAIGNVAKPAGTVAVVVSEGVTAGAAVNMDLINEEFDAALADRNRR